MVKAPLRHEKLSDVSREIRYLRQLDLKKTKIEYLEARLRTFLEQYLARFETLGLSRVFRVRPSEADIPYCNVSQLWYPKDVHISKVRLGRANYAEKAVFYCSDSLNTALIEQKINAPGDSYTVLECELKNTSVDPILLEIGVNDLTARFNPRIGGDRPDPTIAVKEALGNRYNRKKYDLIHRFLVEEFTKTVPREQEHLYKISAAVSAIGLGYRQVHGVCYPSLQSNFRGINIAFKTEAVDLLFRPIECSVVKIVDIIGSPGYLIEEVHKSRSIRSDWTIEWRP